MIGPELSGEALAFLDERHLATLTTLRADGSPHVVAVGFTFDAAAGIARVITSEGSQKVRNVDRRANAVLCQVDRGRWLSLEGTAVVSRDRERVLEGERRYERRYQAPRPNPRRVVIEVTIERVLGRAAPTSTAAPPAAPTAPSTPA